MAERTLCRYHPRWEKLWGSDGGVVAPSSFGEPMEVSLLRVNDLSRSVVSFEQSTTLVVVIEMGARSWLVAGTVPGVERQPLKKLEPDAATVLELIERWRGEAVKAGQTISRVVLAYEAGRDGFWLARWLMVRGIEVHVIHSASVAVSRERKRAKTDRLDAAMLMRVFLGWLRGERGHCGMVTVPTLEEEDAKRPSRERESLVNEKLRITNRMKSALARLGIRGFKAHLRKASQRLEGLRTPEGTGLPPNIAEEIRRDMARLALVREQITEIEKARIERLQRAPNTGANLMVRLLSRVIGIAIETADMLVREVLSRNWRDRRAVARYVGLTGSPDESGTKRREKGLTKAGNARARRGLIQLSWRFLQFQKDSALSKWFRLRTEGPSGARKTTMIVALARKLLIALWRLVTVGEVPEGVVLRPAV
jgi:transposase